MCCSAGKVLLPRVAPPHELLQIFSDQTFESRNFREHIRSYNHVFSFTSLGVHMDETIVANGHGMYSFRAQGAIYHRIGRFYPNHGSRHRFLQLYIYDIEHELQNRMLENPQLHQTIVHKLQQILHRCNPFVHVFRQLAQEPNIQICSLLIKKRHANQPQYNLPTTSQVAVVIVTADKTLMARGRDIKVAGHDENLINIQETVGYYDPLQYPLLFMVLIPIQKIIMAKVSLAENIIVSRFR